MILLRWLFMLTALFPSLLLSSSITITSSTAEVAIDQTLTISVVITYPKSHQIDPPTLQKALFETEKQQPFTVITKKQHQPEVTKDTITQKIDYTVEPWIPGKHPLTAQVVRFDAIDQTKDQPIEVLSNIITVHVLSVTPTDVPFQPKILPLEQQAQIHISKENKKLQDKDLTTKNKQIIQTHSLPWFWILITSALFVILWKRNSLLTKFSKQEKAETITPQERALKALQQLQVKNLPTQQLFDLFYVQLTAIVRYYIEEQYKIHAPEYTTEEFLQIVTETPEFHKNTNKLLRDFLNEADLVKFAQQQSTPEACERAHHAAKQFIEGGTCKITAQSIFE